MSGRVKFAIAAPGVGAFTGSKPGVVVAIVKARATAIITAILHHATRPIHPSAYGTPGNTGTQATRFQIKDFIQARRNRIRNLVPKTPVWERRPGSTASSPGPGREADFRRQAFPNRSLGT